MSTIFWDEMASGDAFMPLARSSGNLTQGAGIACWNRHQWPEMFDADVAYVPALWLLFLRRKWGVGGSGAACELIVPVLGLAFGELG